MTERLMDHRAFAKSAVRICLPSIEALLKNFGTRQTIHIVVMDPTKHPWDSTFKDAIVYEHTVGERKDWQRDYQAIARGKAKQAWQQGQPNILSRMLGAATLEAGDTVYWGSFVWYGVVVAASGIQPWFDMLVSSWIALTMQQVAQDEIHKFQAKEPDTDFLP